MANEQILTSDSGEQRQSEEIFHLAFENAPVGMALITPKGRFHRVNAALCRIFGYTAAELTQKDFRDITHAKDLGRSEELVCRTLAGDIDGFELEKRYVRKDGQIIHGWVKTQLLRHAGQPVYFVIHVMDLTQRKKAEERVIQQERLRALGQMASGIAHDFNNALTPILGYAELLLYHSDFLCDRDKTISCLNIIRDAAEDARKVVGRLREFYRKRKEGEALAAVDLNEVVREVVSLTRPRWQDQAMAGGMAIAIDTDLGDIPPLYGSEFELRQALTNLIFNAIEAMPEGGTIALRTRLDKTAENSVVLTVSDSGSGMDEATRLRCMEPFFTTKGERGTGIGLSVVYGTVSRHEGAIDIQSSPGSGTTFTIRLPLRRQPVAETSAPVAALPPSRLRVLVAEDQPEIRNLTVESLKARGYIVVEAGNGVDAVKKFNAGHFDLVITDMAMPEMNGAQLAAAVKEVAPKIPVILVTGFGDLMQCTDPKPAGVDMILSKPFSLDTLFRAISEVTATPVK